VKDALRTMFRTQGQPRASEKISRLVMGFRNRIGVIDGVRCIIEERGPGVFLLRGFRDGDWEIYGVETLIAGDDPGDSTTGKITASLKQIERETEHGLSAHLLDMNIAPRVDEVFGDRLQMQWFARPLGEGKEKVFVEQY
jgi:hypothetical protein